MAINGHRKIGGILGLLGLAAVGVVGYIIISRNASIIGIPTAIMTPQTVTSDLNASYTITLAGFKPNEHIVGKMVSPIVGQQFDLGSVDSTGKATTTLSAALLILLRAALPAGPITVDVLVTGDLGSTAHMIFYYS